MSINGNITDMHNIITSDFKAAENPGGIAVDNELRFVPGSLISSSIPPIFINDRKSLYQALAFIFAFLLIVFINLRVVCIVADVPFRRLRPINIFITHMSILVIVTSLFHGLLFAERMNLIGSTGDIPCRLFAFGRNLLYAAYPLNVVVVIYERAGTFQDTMGEILVMRTLCLIWTIAALESIPAIFTVEYQENPVTHLGKCVQSQLFGSFGATAIYLFIRFLLRHVAVVGYLFYALYKIRSKIKFLYIVKQIPLRVRGTVRRLRFVYGYSILYIIVWLPTGLIIFADALLARAEKDYSVFQTYLMIIFAMNYVYLMLSPILFLCLNEDVTTNYWYPSITCCKRKYSSSDDHVSTEIGTTRLTSIGNNADVDAA